LDDLSREVYGVLGIPIDAVDMPEVLRRIEAAVANGTPFLISTPNTNFLVASQTNPEFRESLLQSNLCAADGMPNVLIARLLGVPLAERIAGSDIFEALKKRNGIARRLGVFLFGGEDGVAAAAAQKLNSEPSGVFCTGALSPGFGSVEDMSTDAVIHKINASGADFLAVSLGAVKGQAWLLRNHDRLRIPVRSHLGATINFQAGTVKRAPASLRRLGLEWLWRIKEEPHLWRRYWVDGWSLIYLLTMKLLPLMLWLRVQKYLSHPETADLAISSEIRDPTAVVIKLSGSATNENVSRAIGFFRAAADKVNVVIDLSGTLAIDTRFIGCLLMLKRQLKNEQRTLAIVRVPRRIERIFQLNGFGYLLAATELA
jgi:N-acetylglucosaminyldiphosphoundecaprenol N-acetyl-beta-D-mannosaminyltransferase